MTVVLVPTAQCYDRIRQHNAMTEYVSMALVWYALIGKLGLVLVLLTCMQHMRLFQRTGFGDSTTFLGGGQLSKYLMGLGQGSRGGAPS